MKWITKEQAMAAAENGEFGDDIIRSADRVAVILTQSWCSQWNAMKKFVADFSGAEIFCLEYDLTDYFDIFLEFKENTLGNDQVPYIRYYRGGVLVAESNAVSEAVFRGKFEQKARQQEGRIRK